MDINLEEIVKNTKYETYRIFENKSFDNLICDIQLAECMKSEVSYVEDRPEVIAADAELSGPIDLTVSDSLCCSYCHATFKDKLEQRNHYKLDWHRHNLKQSMKGKKYVTEEEFSKLADDVSSISGSESELSDEDLVDEFAASLSLQKQFVRHPKIFFVNKNKQMVSLYRCILHGKEDIPSSSKQLYDLAQTCPSRPKWAILMLGGGHFAGAIFDGNNPILHKTFHSYTVRARQGGSQSSRDNRSATSHPRSAGASLRRYNEASFQQHIQDMLETWAPELEKCHLIFLRAVSHNRTLIFGKNALLKKNDPRIRNIPFPTRRATFKEVKRVHSMLSSLELYGSADTFLSTFPIAPRRPDPETQKDSKQAADKAATPPSSPEKPVQARNKIDRGKPRLSPHRPLPKEVEALAKSTSESSGSEPEFEEIMQVMDFTTDLQEYDDDVPQEQKEKYNKRNKAKNKAKKGNQLNSHSDKVMLSEKASVWCAKVFSVLHDNHMLASVLSQREADGVTEEEGTEAINQAIDTRGNTLLHQASAQGHPDRIRLLLEAGVNPAKRNKDKKTPFKVAKNWEVKKTFRKFQADYPDKYDYKKAEVPGPLTEEAEREEEAQHAERKKAQRKAKKDRLGEKKKLESEKRKVEEEKQKEEEEKQRFLNLSDREKRALAAERRLLACGGSVIVRCYLCASDMTGKVPFSYQSFNFCSMPCLKAHRLQQTKPL